MSADAPGFGVADIQARIARVAFSAWLDIRAESVDGDRVVLSVAVRPDMAGNPETGAIHGGILASLIDVACSYAIIAPTRQSVATVDLRIDFHRVPRAKTLRIESNAVHQGRTISVAEAKIIEPDGRLIASGRAVLSQRAAD